MNIDVFISYHTASSLSVVEAVVNKLESSGVRCWYAPRDVAGPYAASIVRAINACSVFLLILNKPASESPQVLNELNMVTERLSAKEAVSIVPFHTADDDISLEAQYYVRRMHWIDAIKPPLSDRIDELAEKVLYFLGQKPVQPKDNTPAEEVKYRLVSNLPQARLIFAGRDSLLDELKSYFQAGERILYLEGVGGIGKSELAKQYALRNRADYDCILFTSYAGSLKKLACDPSAISIDGIKQRPGETEDEFFSRKWRVFQSLADERTLLIVDNFDVENDPDLEFFQSGCFQIILTTRCKHSNARSVRISAIEDAETLFHIFEENYGSPVDEEDRPYLWELFQLIEGHTYTIELLGKQMDASFLTGKELLKLFKEGRLPSKVSETVAGRAGQKTAFDHIRAVFSTSCLTQEEQQILRLLSLIGSSGIPASRFREWAELASFETVNGLERKSWVRRERGRGNRLSLHPLVIEVVQLTLKPDLDNCGNFIERIGDFTFSAWFRPVAENLSVAENVLAVLKFFTPFDSGKIECFEAMTGYLWQVGHFEDSIRYAEMLLETCSEKFTEASMITGFMAKNVGGCYFNSGRLKESIPFYKRGLQCMLLSGAEETEDLAMAYEKVGRCYTWDYEQNFAKAEEYFRQALEIRQRLVSALKNGQSLSMFHAREHYNSDLARERLGETYFEMGRMYQAAGDYSKALEYVKLCEEMGFANHKNASGYAYIYYDKGVCHYNLGLEARKHGDETAAQAELELAEKELRRALEINSAMRGDIALDTIANRECLADTYVAMGCIGKAKEEYVTVKNALENLFGPTHARVQSISSKLSQLM